MKTYRVTHNHLHGRGVHTGTIQELVEKFSYTLVAGHSWDASIKTNPKTAQGLVNALNKAATARRCYFDSYDIEEVI